GDQYQYAFTGISIDVYSDDDEVETKENIVLDLSDFESMEFQMKITSGKKIPVQLLAFLDGYSVQGDNNSLIFYEQFLDYDHSKRTQIIPLERFAIPNWWRKSHPNVKTDEFKIALKQIKAINVQSCIIIKKNVLDNYLISNIRFTSTNLHYLIILIVGATGSLFLFMYTYFKQKKMLVVSYSQIESQKTSPSQFQGNDILSYINKHYANPELSVLTLEKQLNVSKNKLSEILKGEANLSFKQYLNAIRVLEAKRLLSETDLSISEIAYQVGYSNVSHFNRVFKSLENCSPSFFKEEKS
ncbi:MAG: YesN/AraC family two-component response regulator, partial [Saprospiraceae bacterium]